MVTKILLPKRTPYRFPCDSMFLYQHCWQHHRTMLAALFLDARILCSTHFLIAQIFFIPCLVLYHLQGSFCLNCVDETGFTCQAKRQYFLDTRILCSMHFLIARIFFIPCLVLYHLQGSFCLNCVDETGFTCQAKKKFCSVRTLSLESERGKCPDEVFGRIAGYSGDYI